MIFVLIALWIVSGLLLFSDPHSSASRRLAAVSAFGGAGALAAVLDGQLIPHLVSAYPDHHVAVQQILYTVQSVSSVSSYYGVPYAFVWFALAYRPVRLRSGLQQWLPVLLLIPIAACLLFTPWYTVMYPITFSVVIWWAVPYLLVGSVLILTKKTTYRGGFDRTHIILCIAVLPPALLFMILNYVLPSLGFLRMYVYNTLMIGVGFGVFLIGMFTYGFMGVRIAIERRRMDYALRAVTSGTAILNHAIKNDVGKMRLFGDKIKTYAEATNQPELLADIGAVMAASRHIQEMISRVHKRTEDLAVRPGNVDLGELIRDTLTLFGPRLERIRLQLSIADGWMCRVDAAQVAEALQNVISNALEAMEGEGELAVRLLDTKRELRIEIADNGPGMDRRQMAVAMEPFHTTKAGSGANFGLGLPYAYHVMRKHGGNLLLRSAPSSGTTVWMSLPKRAVGAERIMPAAGAAEGRDAHV